MIISMPSVLDPVEAAAAQIAALGLQSLLRDLRRGGQREAVVEGEIARHLEGRQLALAMLDQPLQQLRRWRASLPQHNAGLHLLAADLVGHGDDGGFPYLEKGVEDAFQLPGSDVLAAPAHHVLEAPDDIEEAPFVLAEEIAGPEPVAMEGGRRGLGLAV